MSIWSNLYIGTSGMTAHSEGITSVGDNIANVSTVGFKASRAGFSNVLGGISGNSRLGAGVRFGGTQTSYAQGGLQQTSAPLDLAIMGKGFLIAKGSHQGQDGSYFTRDGRLSLNSEGLLVNNEGLRIQGYSFDAKGNLTSNISDIQLSGKQSAPLPTSKAQMAANLDAGAEVKPVWDINDPNNTSNFATSTTVYDSLGTGHRIDIYFNKTADGSWQWHGVADGGELTGGSAGNKVEIASGTLGFTPDGALDTEVTTSSSINFAGATPGQTIAFDFGSSITTDGGNGLGGTSQFAGSSSVSSQSQDGFGYGDLVDVAVSEDGTVVGHFSNGQSRNLARVALATFSSEESLQSAGNQMFQATTASGEPLIDAAGTAGRGGISSGSLESSNVDLTGELVTLIAYQRAFQANVRTVTTADEMLSEVAAMKR